MTGALPIRVLAAPVFDPGTARLDVEMPGGLTVAEIVASAVPELPCEAYGRLRVALVTSAGSELIEPRYWARVRPRPGVRVVIRVVPGKGSLRAVLMIAVTVASIATGNLWGAQLATAIGTTSAVGTALVTFGVNVVGSLLVNALVPPPEPDNGDRRQQYTITGWRNRYDPDGAIPMVMGTHRYAPPFAATSYTEVVGDWQYVRALFTFGYGPLELSDFRIGETSIADYDEVEIEVRDGRATDAPISLYPRQILEESIGTELTRPMPRDDAGNIIDHDASIETPVVRTTAEDTDTVSINLAWPGGLIYVDDDGDKRTEGVDIRIEQRPAAGGGWQQVETLRIRARKAEEFYRQHTWQLPSRGRWQIRLTMLTEEPANLGRQRRTVWVSMQSIRPEYPLNARDPLALVALRVKATHQLAGQLDDFSAIARRVCLDYDSTSRTWIERPTANPASLYRLALQGPANPRPVPDSGIDFAQLEDWHDFCRIKSLRYDRVIDDPSLSLRDVLTEIAGAGRASPRHDGMRWGVTIDRPQTLIVDHISPRNSWNFRATRSYVRPPHAFRVKFNDRDADYAPAERLVRWPGYTGEITLTEALDLPGKTRADEVWREARRRMHETRFRPDSYEVMQDGPIRVATRGDQVAISQDVLTHVQRAARVVSVLGEEIRLDELVSVAEGADYAIRFRVISAADTIGQSMVRAVKASPGETATLRLDGAGPAPKEGDLVMFGLAGRETLPAVVTGIEMGDDMACLIRAVPAAPEIDEVLDAETPPAWSSRVGAELPPRVLQPPQPRFQGVFTGASGTGTRQRIEVQLVPGSGPVPTARYGLRHRPAGQSAWATVYFPAADGGYALTTYPSGDQLELRAFALSSSGVAGPETPILPVTVGSGDQPLPEALPVDGVTVTALPGGARIEFDTSADPNVAAVQLYCSRATSLDRALHAEGRPLPVSPSRTWQILAGDLTRRNLLRASSMDDPAVWSLGQGWSVAGGTARHDAAAGAGDLTQSVSLASGKWYRIGYRLAGVQDGEIIPRLTGTSDRVGTPASTSGPKADRLQAVTGNTAIAWRGSAQFTGQIDDVLLYQETATCLEQGIHHFWLEPVNRDGVPGPAIGPFSVTII